jgi:hypothetical protein
MIGRLIDLFGALSDLFFKRVPSLYICTTIALVGKVCGRFGAKRAEVTFRLFYLWRYNNSPLITAVAENNLN